MRMTRMKRLRPTPGTLIGTIALVFAFSGAAVAANGTVNTEDIAKRAVTGPKIAKDSVKSGKIVDGKVKAKDLAEGVIPAVPNQAYGRINRTATSAAATSNSVGITGVAAGSTGITCYDLAVVPVSGSATIVEEGPADRPGATAELQIGAHPGCAAPYTDAATSTRALSTASPVAQPLDDHANRDLYVQFIGG
jgi:hypothetical protein